MSVLTFLSVMTVYVRNASAVSVEQADLRTTFGDRALELALSGGEDYELLFTAGNEVIERVKAAASCPVTIIGEIGDGKTGEITLVDGKGEPVDLPGTGWEHFIRK